MSAIPRQLSRVTSATTLGPPAYVQTRIDPPDVAGQVSRLDSVDVVYRFRIILAIIMPQFLLASLRIRRCAGTRTSKLKPLDRR